MTKAIAVIGAPSSIGIRPYDDSRETRGMDQAPAILREHGLADGLGARDLGDVKPPPYKDFERPAGRARNETEIEAYSRDLAEAVAAVLSSGEVPVVLGGDCSIILGCLLGARRSQPGKVGLIYADGHADFATPKESITGSVASMCLAMAVGRGNTPLARLDLSGPLVDGSAVALVGRRDEAHQWYGHHALATYGLLDLPTASIEEGGWAAAARRVLERVTAPSLEGFWIHLDVDLINPDILPAVDSPEPGGPNVDELVEFLGPLVSHPRALGLDLTLYDPCLDPDRACAPHLVQTLTRALRGDW